MAARLVAFFVLVLAGTLAAGAEPLQRLHVRSFTLTADTSHPRVDVPFNVTLTIRVAENVNALQNVYLPAFAGPEELGDERELHHDAHGTLYRETMRLVAHASGPLSIGSAYLDAVDARDGTPKRFSSGGLQLDVSGPVADAGNILRLAAWSLAAAAALALLLVAASTMRGRRAAAVPAPSAAPDPPLPAPAPAPAPAPFVDPVESAVADLRERRDRPAVLALRRELWRDAGAREGETLADVLARAQVRDERRRRMILSVERAAFIEDVRLQSAIQSVLDLTEERKA